MTLTGLYVLDVILALQGAVCMVVVGAWGLRLEKHLQRIERQLHDEAARRVLP